MKKRITALLYCALAASSASAIVAAQNPSPREETQLRQRYTGVVPGSGNNLPRVEEIKKRDGVWVTWPGFVLLEDGGSRLFVQTTQPLQYSVSNNDSTVTVSLKKAKVYLLNNRNPLVTSYFNTPLKRAYLKKGKKETLLILELKVNATPSISNITDKDGYHYMFVDFAPGDYPTDSARLVPSFTGIGRAPADTPSPAAEGGADFNRTNP